MWRVAAVVLFGGYLALWLFGWLDIKPSNVPQISRELFWGLAIGGPCFLVGAAVARWWMPAAVGVFFVALLPLGERCVQARDLDLVSITCSGVDGADVPLLARDHHSVRSRWRSRGQAWRSVRAAGRRTSRRRDRIGHGGSRQLIRSQTSAGRASHQRCPAAQGAAGAVKRAGAGAAFHLGTRTGAARLPKCSVPATDAHVRQRHRRPASPDLRRSTPRRGSTLCRSRLAIWSSS